MMIVNKILFVSYGAGHVNTLLPVYKRFVSEHDFECKYLELTTAAQDNLNQLLAAVDYIEALSFTVGMQAALLRKPLVTIKLSIFSHDALYNEINLALEPRT